MPTRPFSARRQSQLLGELLRPIDVSSGLLFCNHVLLARRGLPCDPRIAAYVQSHAPPLSPFLVHCAARQVLLKSLGESNRPMTSETFSALIALLWEQLDHDPAMQDPAWKESDPTGWAIRYVGLQGETAGILLQGFGLAVGLFTDSLGRGPDEAADIPARLQACLRMHPSVFMRTGFVAGAVRTATNGAVKLPGTITTEVVEQWAGRLGDGVSENWNRFVELTSCTPREFGQISRHSGHAAEDMRYDLFSFNVLRSRPLIDLGDGHFVAPDPHLVYARVAAGMYYDLLDSDGEHFTRPFGYRFAHLVHNLTASACGTGRVWADTSVPRAVRSTPPSRHVDVAYIGDSATVLIECKSLRPSTKLLMLGDPLDAEAMVARVAGAVQQLYEHAEAIRAHKWSSYGLAARDCVGVVVTYGNIPTVNGTLFRRRVAQVATTNSAPSIPYLVLSLPLFDSLLRLVEHGNALDDVVHSLTNDDDAAFPGRYEQDLWLDAISEITRRRGQAFLDTLPSEESVSEPSGNGRGSSA
ncbi:MAG: hypothetical protein IT436_14080 [Phycisphaerales bacterium]|nr:hypothetical protein [Phycisphaerales bacterium]